MLKRLFVWAALICTVTTVFYLWDVREFFPMQASVTKARGMYRVAEERGFLGMLVAPLALFALVEFAKGTIDAYRRTDAIASSIGFLASLLGLITFVALGLWGLLITAVLIWGSVVFVRKLSDTQGDRQ